tara:strand:+ start:1167 stop:1466 length:300 start_codon:yes stop_codon:yes gene_type:complete
MLQFEPLGDKLIVKPVEADEMSSGGIIIADLENQRTIKAEVISAGPGTYQFGEFVPTDVKVGDLVLYQHFSALKFEYENDEYHTVRASEIICKLSKNEK